MISVWIRYRRSVHDRDYRQQSRHLDLAIRLLVGESCRGEAQRATRANPAARLTHIANNLLAASTTHNHIATRTATSAFK